MSLIQTQNVECEIFSQGKYFGGGVQKISWSFDYTPDKQGIFSMSVKVHEQELKIDYYEYNEETDEEDRKEMNFFIKDYFKQVKVVSEVENFLNGFSISFIRIDMNKQTIEVTLK